MNIFYSLEIKMRKESISLLYFWYTILSQTGEILYEQMQQLACLPIPEDPIILMTVPQFLPLGQAGLFSFLCFIGDEILVPILGRNMFHQGAKFIHIWMGFQVFAFDIRSHSSYAPLQQDSRQNFLENWLCQFTIFLKSISFWNNWLLSNKRQHEAIRFY